MIFFLKYYNFFHIVIWLLKMKKNFIPNVKMFSLQTWLKNHVLSNYDSWLMLSLWQHEPWVIMSYLQYDYSKTYGKKTKVKINIRTLWPETITHEGKVGHAQWGYFNHFLPECTPKLAGGRLIKQEGRGEQIHVQPGYQQIWIVSRNPSMSHWIARLWARLSVNW